LQVAEAHGVPALCLRRAAFADAEARDRAIGHALTDAALAAIPDACRIGQVVEVRPGEPRVRLA
ncbi:MAG TPA: hypothetical protein VHP64_04050, partial [Candidatus Limnocylindria bacterium]|nr:hypothetical protein [Candidatus Limnocylindria bacterium]